MKRSSERFLTTHTGSLPRPEDLIRTMYAKEEGVPVDAAALAERVASAVEEVVHKQADRGVAGRRVAVLPQRALPQRGGVPVRDRRGHAARVRDYCQGRHHPADRLPGSRDGTTHSARRLEPRRLA